MASSICLRSSVSSLASSSLSSAQIASGRSLTNSTVSFRSGSFPARRLTISCSVAQPETVQKVIEIVSKQLASEEGSVHPHSKFQDLGADSLDQVEIVMALEEAFKISVDESGAEAIVTVQDAANLIEKAKSDVEEKAKAA